MIITPRELIRGGIGTFKLVGGDELVARLEDETETHYTLHKPLLVMMAQQGFGLMPYVLTGGPDVDLEVSKAHVVCSTTTIKQVADEYVKQTTGLQVP